MLSKQPNFFIAGAARSGTTWLWNNLKSHPRIFLPLELKWKEPAFFSIKGCHRSWQDYLNIFASARTEQRWIGEASTAYLTDPESAARLFAHNSAARIILVLRNPVARAKSLYDWMAQKGYEYADCIETALSLEESRCRKRIPNPLEPEYRYNYHYFRSGLYHDQVNRYRERFGAGLLILRYEALAADPEREMEKVWRFLEIDPIPVSHQRINQTVGIESPVIQFILRKLTRFYLAAEPGLSQPGADLEKSFLDQCRSNLAGLEAVATISPETRHRILALVTTIAGRCASGEIRLNRDSIADRDRFLEFGCSAHRRPRKMRTSTRDRLQEGYRSDILRLSELTGIDFSGWLA